MRALVTGGTGFIGPHLLAGLDRPVVLSRRPDAAKQKLKHPTASYFAWDPERERPPAAAFEGVDCIFHLAGEPVAEGRWSEYKKARVRESRVAGTRHLVETLRELPQKPKTLISCSAVGFYGSRGDELLTEEALPPPNLKDDFLAQVCVDWEQAALPAEDLGIRVVMPRVGIVLGEDGGALGQMLPPFRWGFGSPLGSGTQYMPWIHLTDLVYLLKFAAEKEAIRGPLNAVAPNPVTNQEFSVMLGRVLGRWTLPMNVPSFMLYLMIGGFAQVLLASQRVVPKKALDHGFTFRFDLLEPALRDILTEKTK